MNKLDFLRKLERALSVLEKEERREILAFYEERFYNGTIYENKTEAEVIAELESPEVIARNVLEEYGVSPTYVKTKEERYTNVSAFKVIMLLGFDLIIATWLIPALFSATVALFGSVFSYIGTFSLLMGDVSTVDEFVFAFLTAGYVLVFLIAIFLLSVTIGVIKQILVWHLNVFKLKGREKWIKKMSRFSVDAWFKRHRRANRLKNVLLVGALVTLAYTGLWGINHYDWVKAEYSSGEVQNETITEDLASEITAGDAWDIQTDFGTMDVEVVLVSGSEVVIKRSFYEDDEFEYDFDYTNNVLTLSTNTDEFEVFWNFAEIFRLIGENHAIRIEIPESLVLEDATIHTINGTVDLRSMDLDDLEIVSTNGDVLVADVTITGDLTISSTNGNLTVRNIDVTGNGVLELSITNGILDVEDTNFTEYYLETTNGRIELDRLNVDNQDGTVLDAVTTNGDIQLNDVYVSNIDLVTTNGDIQYFNTDTSFSPNSFDRETTNGSIETNVHE